MEYEKQEIRDSPEDVAMQNYIRARANYSLALLGASFIRHGSGRFINIRSREEFQKAESIDDIE